MKVMTLSVCYSHTNRLRFEGKTSYKTVVVCGDHSSTTRYKVDSNYDHHQMMVQIIKFTQKLFQHLVRQHLHIHLSITTTGTPCIIQALNSTLYSQGILMSYAMHPPRIFLTALKITVIKMTMELSM